LYSIILNHNLFIIVLLFIFYYLSIVIVFHVFFSLNYFEDDQ